MSADLLAAIASNLCISALLGTLAFAVQRRFPLLAHLLWLLALTKLVTPPLFGLPLLSWEGALVEPTLPASVALAGSGGADGASATRSAAEPLAAQISDAASAAPAWSWLVVAWLLGSLLVVVHALWRAVSFERALRRARVPAPAAAARLAAELAATLGIRRAPVLFGTHARIAPLLWWRFGRVQIHVPQQLLEGLAHEELRWILAHELAHVRRRDHWVRWLELFATVVFWWNPLLWWIRRQLRASEELCCDALVLRTLEPRPKSYARSLLSVAEYLVTPTVRPPVFASAIDSGGELERRIHMILDDKLPLAPRRWVRAAALLCAATFLPLGIARAQKPDYDAVAKRLEAAVQAGELSSEQAAAMMGALAHEHFLRTGKHPEQKDSKKDAKNHEKQRQGAKAAEARGSESELHRRLGIDEGGVRRITADMKERGFRPEQIEGSMRVLARITHALRQGQQLHSKQEIVEHLEKKLQLSRPQIDAVFGYAKRLAQSSSGGERESLAAMKKRYDAVMQRLSRAVREGSMSKEEATKRLEAVKQEMERSLRRPTKDGASDMEARKKRYVALERRIKDAVARGELSKEDAETKLHEMRRQLSEERGAAERGDDMAARKRDYAAAEARVKAAIEAGKISAEDGKKRLEALRVRLFSGERRR